MASRFGPGQSISGRQRIRRRTQSAKRGAQRGAAIQRRFTEIQNIRARRQARAEAQIIQSEVEAAGAARGVGGTSTGVVGEVASIASQFGERAGFAAQQEGVGEVQSGIAARRRSRERRQQTFSTLVSLPAQFGLI